MRKNVNIWILSIIIICFSLFLTGCKQNKEDELKEKVITELKYANEKIIDMLNGLNNISFESYTLISKEVKLDNDEQKKESEGSNGGSSENSDSEGQGGNSSKESGKEDTVTTTEMITDSVLEKDINNVDWSLIKSEIELLNENWSIILLDLYSLNVKNDVILDFSKKLDACIIAINNEDKQQSLTSLAGIYSSLPEFLKEVQADNNLQKIRQTQSYVINAYTIASDMGNTEIKNNITKAIETYSQIMSDIDYTNDKTYKINKIYVLLNELANSLDEKDEKLFYIKYKNFMEEINKL